MEITHFPPFPPPACFPLRPQTRETFTHQGQASYSMDHFLLYLSSSYLISTVSWDTTETCPLQFAGSNRLNILHWIFIKGCGWWMIPADGLFVAPGHTVLTTPYRRSCLLPTDLHPPPVAGFTGTSPLQRATSGTVSARQSAAQHQHNCHGGGQGKDVAHGDAAEELPRGCPGRGTPLPLWGRA